MMTIETDCDNPRVVFLTKFNHFKTGFFWGPVEERRRRLKKRPTQGKLGVIFLDDPFLWSHSFMPFFCITLVQILRLQNDLLGQYRCPVD